MKPLFDKIIVEPGDQHTKIGDTELSLPDESIEKPVGGKVLAVGPDVKQINEGDEVLFGMHSGTEVNLHGKQVLLMREVDIYVVL